jgi:hypothetical protein
MKKRFSLTRWDISLVEIADILVTLWAIGILLVYFPLTTQDFLVEWRWAFLAIAIIVGIKPIWRMLYGPHSDEAHILTKQKITKNKSIKKSKNIRKKK